MDLDLDTAAAEGIISEDQAIALRNFQAQRARESLSMAEKFQIYGGLNDVVAAAGLALTLVALGSILGSASLHLLYLIFPAASLALLDRVSPRHKPCLASVMLAGSLASLVLAIPMTLSAAFPGPPNSLVLVLFGLLPAFAYAMIFWRKSRFPLVPAAMATIATLASAVILAPEFGTVGAERNVLGNLAIVIAGVATLFSAVWWDITDVRRETERSQVAFWLHCCAGFFISRGAYGLVTGHAALDENYALGLGSDSVIPFLLIFGSSVLISLVLDRRSLLIGSIMPTITFFGNAGSEVYGMLFAGGSLLIFTYFWNGWRRRVLTMLPTAISAQLPRLDVVHAGQRPTRRHLEFLRRARRS